MTVVNNRRLLKGVRPGAGVGRPGRLPCLPEGVAGTVPVRRFRAAFAGESQLPLADLPTSHVRLRSAATLCLDASGNRQRSIRF